MESDVCYNVKLRFVSAGPLVYKYSDKKWNPIRMSSMNQKSKGEIIVSHPDSPSTGEFWMEKLVSFEHVKIRPNEAKQGRVSNKIVIILH